MTPTTTPTPEQIRTVLTWAVLLVVFGPPLLFGLGVSRRHKRRLRRRRVHRRLFGPPSYEEYIHSAAWRQFSEEYYARFGRRCHWPGCRNRATQLHHMTYERFGHERMADVVGLCRSHHAMIPTNPHPPYEDQAEWFGIRRRHFARAG